MKRMQKIFTLLALLLSFTAFAGPYPNHNVRLDDILRQRKDGWVYDYADLLTDSEERQLNNQIQNAVNARGGNHHGELAVLLVDQMRDARGDSYDVSDFSTKVFTQWGIGNRQDNDGILLVVSLRPRKLFIATGYGREVNLANTDAMCSRICRETIAPLMKRGDYLGALSAGVDKINGTYSLRQQEYGTYRTNSLREQAQEAERVRVYNLPENVTARRVAAEQEAIADRKSSAAFWSTVTTILLFTILAGVVYLLYRAYMGYKDKKAAEEAAVSKRTSELARELESQAKRIQYAAQNADAWSNDKNYTPSIQMAAKQLNAECAELSTVTDDVLKYKNPEDMERQITKNRSFISLLDNTKEQIDKIKERDKLQADQYAEVERLHGRVDEFERSLSTLQPKLEAASVAAEKINGPERQENQPASVIEDLVRRHGLMLDALQSAKGFASRYEPSAAETQFKKVRQHLSYIQEKTSALLVRPNELRNIKLSIPRSIMQVRASISEASALGLSTGSYEQLVQALENRSTAPVQDWEALTLAVSDVHDVVRKGVNTEKSRVAEIARAAREKEERRLREIREREERARQEVRDRENRERAERERVAAAAAAAIAYSSSSSSSNDSYGSYDSSDSFGGGSTGGGGGGSDW